ncbi:transposase-like protein [Sporomusaceae bacterium BoRhaA]|uniref:transposase n=1 Tax=Pelorhabdus rhamnosifermentans TaxID=2772457 RepID=UPI0035E40D41|nr:transposase-like protein [Pelorhabdus rhamnosifermentans]
MSQKEKELVELLSKKCTNMEDVHKLLKSLFKGTLEEMLEAEMDEHLGYEKHECKWNNQPNFVGT